MPISARGGGEYDSTGATGAGGGGGAGRRGSSFIAFSQSNFFAGVVRAASGPTASSFSSQLLTTGSRISPL
jgi:hypothetical protein